MTKSTTTRTFCRCAAAAVLFIAATAHALAGIKADNIKIAIAGEEAMTFGPTPDSPYANNYSLTVTDAGGKAIAEAELAAAYADFCVEWDVKGFKTANDQQGQYCDSYGTFAVNSSPRLATTFLLRNVPMNFYGFITATMTLGGKTVKAEKGVVALGNRRRPVTQVLPAAGYPAQINGYSDMLVGRQVLAESHGQAQDIVFGRWCAAGSDPTKSGRLLRDADGTKYIRFSGQQPKKSHVMAIAFTPPTSVMVFTSKVRFHHGGTVMTLTSRFPFWSSAKAYTNPVTLRFDGTSLALNGTALAGGGKAAAIEKGRWYVVQLHIDKADQTCTATVKTDKGKTVGQTGRLKWTEPSSPNFFSIGMDNEATGHVDIAGCEATAPNAADERHDIKVEKGHIYRMEVTYQGTLSAGYVNTDLAGYTLGSHNKMATDTIMLACPADMIDLRIAADATGVAKIKDVKHTKMPKRQKRSKPRVHHIGDSTSANSGSWAWRLERIIKERYPKLAALCDFSNKGAGGRNLATYYQQGKLAAALLDICPGDVVMIGNNGTNGMNSTFEDDLNYYIDAAEAMGAKVIINSYTPHGAVGRYAGGYNKDTHTFSSYRRDAYDVIARKVAGERLKTDSMYIGFVEIGRNADAIFSAYVADYKANGYASADEAAQAINGCFKDHNHYNNHTLACDLMLNGYRTCPEPGIVEQMANLLQALFNH